LPLYFFDLKYGTRLVDPKGLICRDDNDAESKGRQIAAEVGVGKPKSHPQRYVVVINFDG
jgi:hypothetical protein